jgi:hypothetical protein
MALHFHGINYFKNLFYVIGNAVVFIRVETASLTSYVNK